MLDLTSSLTKLEDDLERAINSKLSLDEKSIKVRQLLDKIVSIEASIAKFNSMLISNNNENTNTQENGNK